MSPSRLFDHPRVSGKLIGLLPLSPMNADYRNHAGLRNRNASRFPAYAMGSGTIAGQRASCGQHGWKQPIAAIGSRHSGMRCRRTDSDGEMPDVFRRSSRPHLI
jgi:hypothetical protein